MFRTLSSFNPFIFIILYVFSQEVTHSSNGHCHQPRNVHKMHVCPNQQRFGEILFEEGKIERVPRTFLCSSNTIVRHHDGSLLKCAPAMSSIFNGDIGKSNGRREEMGRHGMETHVFASLLCGATKRHHDMCTMQSSTAGPLNRHYRYALCCRPEARVHHVTGDESLPKCVTRKQKRKRAGMRRGRKE